MIFFQCGIIVPTGITLLWLNDACAANQNPLFKNISASNTINKVAQLEPSPSPTTNPESEVVPNEEVPSENNQPDTTPSTPEPVETSQPEQSLLVKKIEVKCGLEDKANCKVFRPDSEEIKSITQSVEGKTVTVSELQGVADKITQLYLNRGYITSRAVLVDQTIASGVVVFRIFEGGVEEIQVEGTKKVSPKYIINRIKLAQLNPLNKDQLEDQLRLLRADPLFKNVEASLRPGKTFGQSILIVRVTEANSFKASFGIDNYSPPSVGSEQFGVGLAYRNLIVSGDQIATSYKRSTTGGANLYDLSYRIPLNPMDGTLQIRAAINDYKITDPEFANLDIRGDSNLYEITYRQPLIRSPREEFALSLGFTFQDGQTFIFNNLPIPFGIGPDADGVSRTSVFKFGQDYLKRDPKGAWSLRSQFNIGIGLFDATINDHPTPDSRFLSWLGQVQRVQQLNNDNLLIAALDLQLTPDSLLPSQQFVIGGGQSVRGFRQNARYGDNGVRFSLEDRITLERNEAGASTMQLAPFVDLGVVWNHPDNPNNDDLPSQRFLAGAGLGFLWEPIPHLNLRLDYAVPFVDLRDRGENAQDHGFYFSVYYTP
ncbi:ShlB/FhaC/HecB family hemolysin secretion/activation protein [Pelatocladus sp. BLCC-F211]|uniref:ShlB/FhaC/HecB family hemolysin secretion/activation protein n=1 Tax=Pelatocladus sp. BLCC-F211 TaxID=3342752 RepID=UPI0035B6E3ED